MTSYHQFLTQECVSYYLVMILNNSWIDYNYNIVVFPSLRRHHCLILELVVVDRTVQAGCSYFQHFDVYL